MDAQVEDFPIRNGMTIGIFSENNTIRPTFAGCPGVANGKIVNSQALVQAHREVAAIFPYKPSNGQLNCDK
jgi:hypothetical protein